MKGSSYSLRVMKNAKQYAGKNTLETPSKVRLIHFSNKTKTFLRDNQQH
jgi:hypothetical protein